MWAWYHWRVPEPSCAATILLLTIKFRPSRPVTSHSGSAGADGLRSQCIAMYSTKWVVIVCLDFHFTLSVYNSPTVWKILLDMKTHLVSLDRSDKDCYNYTSTFVHITNVDDDKAAKEVWVSVVSSLHRVWGGERPIACIGAGTTTCHIFILYNFFIFPPH